VAGDNARPKLAKNRPDSLRSPESRRQRDGCQSFAGLELFPAEVSGHFLNRLSENFSSAK